MTTPCIISVAITGSLPKKSDNPAVPITPAEQIESTHAAFEAGATLVHLHVRNDDGSPTSNPERFAQVMGQKDDSKVRAVQFHPNLSYEDFVRGWRPTGEGKLSLADGVFMEAIKAAAKDPTSKFVVVIEEINRGNPAQIFGELLTLLEAGKRTPNEALELCYPDADGRRRPVHIPENLYVIGTMNIADRSLALVDLALRRRFAFVGLEPRLGTAWREWVAKECAIDPDLVADMLVSPDVV